MEGSPPTWERSVHLLASTFKRNPQQVSIYQRSISLNPNQLCGKETLKRVYVRDVVCGCAILSLYLHWGVPQYTFF